MVFSIVIPVYNRPEEIREVLESLTRQTYRNFEVLVIEDGSDQGSESIVDSFRKRIDVRYHYKPNSGQGFSRNAGFDLARGDYFVILDSDCIVPEFYLETVKKGIEDGKLDAFGGPDRNHPGFTPIQKAISYSMTSPFTTGGIRGRKRRLGVFHPRSFNMGLSRRVYEKTGGFKWTRLGEDLEFSIRIIKAGFRVGLIEDAFVYHKRRTRWTQFFKQLHFFGKARINVYTEHPDALKWVHCLPALFVLFSVLMLLMGIRDYRFPSVVLILWLMFSMVVLIDSSIRNRSLGIGLLSVAAGFIQIFGYGLGFLQAYINRIVLKRREIVRFAD